MKKSEILKIILIIFGLNTFIYGIINLTQQFVTFLSISKSNEAFSFSMIIGFSAATIVILSISFFLVFKSEIISQWILKKDNDLNIKILIKKNEAIQLFLIGVSIFFLLGRFPALVASCHSIVINFLKDNLPHNNFTANDIANIVLYTFSFVILTNSKQLSNWLLSKIE